MIWTEESIAFLRDAAAMSDYYRVITGKIAPHLPENAHVCDAGCGIGELSIALAPYCRHVTAVDADELAVKTLESHRPERVAARCGDIEALAPDKPYDAWYSVSLAERRTRWALPDGSAAEKFFLSSATIRTTASAQGR